MTKKDYIAIAEMLHSMEVNPDHCPACYAKHERTEIITRELALIMKRDNPRFNAGKFFEAAGYPQLTATRQGLN